MKNTWSGKQVGAVNRFRMLIRSKHSGGRYE